MGPVGLTEGWEELLVRNPTQFNRCPFHTVTASLENKYQMLCACCLSIGKGLARS
jgi:hypothetical protein